MSEELIPTKIKMGKTITTVDIPKFCVLVCNSGEDPSTPDIPTMTTVETLYHGERVQKLHPDTLHWWNHVWCSSYDKPESEYIKEPKAADQIRDMEIKGAVHLLGMIDLTFKFRNAGLSLHIEYPETFLHPKVQRYLMSFIDHARTIQPDAKKREAMLRRITDGMPPEERNIDMNL